VAQSIASCVISSVISAFFMTAFRSDILAAHGSNWHQRSPLCWESWSAEAFLVWEPK